MYRILCEFTPVAGGNVTVSSVTRQLFITNASAGVPATYAVGIPGQTPAATILDGQKFGICTLSAVTSIGVTAGTGVTILSPPTALIAPATTGAASCLTWEYSAANSAWFRIQ
jgi:hypothetical protein